MAELNICEFDKSMLVDKKSTPLWKRLVLRIFGSIFGEVFAYEKNQMRYFIGYCKKPGYFIEHERGYKGLISCPKCLEERARTHTHTKLHCFWRFFEVLTVNNEKNAKRR